MRITNSFISRLRRSNIARLFWVMPLLMVSPWMVAQTLTVRLINAKSGKPIQGQYIRVIWDGQMPVFDHYPLSDKQGNVHIDIPKGTKSLILQSGPKVGKEPNRIPYLECSHYGEILIEEVLKNGIPPDNRCNSNVMPTAKAGEILYFIELIPWWMPDMQ